MTLFVFYLERNCLSSNLSIATNQIFGAGQLRQGHGSASMELLGTDADFRTKAKLVAVGEASGSIHIHRCRIHSSRLLPSKCSRIQLPVYSIRPAARFVYVFVLNGYKPLLNDLKFYFRQHFVTESFLNILYAHQIKPHYQHCVSSTAFVMP